MNAPKLMRSASSADSHRGLAEVFEDTLWAAGTWGPSLKRLTGAMPTKQKRFEGGRSEGTWLPPGLIPDIEDLGVEF